MVAIYPHRETVPRDLWLRLIGSAQHDIGILDSTAMSLPASRQPIVAALAERAESGLRSTDLYVAPGRLSRDRRSLNTVIADLKNRAISALPVLYAHQTQREARGVPRARAGRREALTSWLGRQPRSDLARAVGEDVMVRDLTHPLPSSQPSWYYRPIR